MIGPAIEKSTTYVEVRTETLSSTAGRLRLVRARSAKPVIFSCFTVNWREMFHPDSPARTEVPFGRAGLLGYKDTPCALS
jgi:hypothetical protein